MKQWRVDQCDRCHLH